MKKLADIIIESGLENKIPSATRLTVRAIILKDHQLFMTYSKKFDDYMTPGGGVEENEDFIEALKRELVEEVGVVAKTIEPIGYIEELRSGQKDAILYQKSHYYSVSIDHMIETQPEDYEIRFGMTPVWVSIHEVIEKNDYQIRTRLKKDGLEIHPYSTLTRENIVLNYIKEVNKL